MHWRSRRSSGVAKRKPNKALRRFGAATGAAIVEISETEGESEDGLDGDDGMYDELELDIVAHGVARMGESLGED